MQDLGPEAIWVTAALCILCTITAALRVVARRHMKASLGVDDYLIGLALLLVWGLLADIAVAVHWGLGKDTVDVIKKYGGVTGILRALMINEILYGAALAIIKFSILLMYSRIFPTKFFRVAAAVLGSITLMWWVAVLFVSIFQCTPVPYAYDKTLIATYPHAHCINTNNFYIGNAVPNIVTDLLILALPARDVWKLQIPKTQRGAILSIFLMGGLVVVISIVRLVSLFKLDLNGPNVTRDLTVPWIYTSIEPCIGIISACLPTLKPIIKFVLPKNFWQSTKVRSTGNSFGGENAITSGKSAARKSFPIFGNVKGDDGTGSFERLNEGESDSVGGAYKMGTTCTVSRNKNSVDAGIEEFPMHGIKIQRDVGWEEEMRR